MIEGKVAAILNSRELAINRGAKHGVEEGMEFAVMDPTGHSITDPTTGEEIGSVMRTKIRVRIVEVQENLSVGRTYEMTPGSYPLFGTPSMMELFKTEPSRPRTLRTDEAVFQPLTEAQSYVKRGDPVRQLAAES